MAALICVSGLGLNRPSEIASQRSSTFSSCLARRCFLMIFSLLRESSATLPSAPLDMEANRLSVT
eukprot:31524-Pelagococcus_subviridis.AAC.12